LSLATTPLTTLRSAAWCLLMTIPAVLSTATLRAQAPDTSAIVPPLFFEPAAGNDGDPDVNLVDQKVAVMLMQNAAFVRLEYTIANPQPDSIRFLVRLPIAGYILSDEGDTSGVSIELLDPDFQVENEPGRPRLVDADTAIDEILHVALGPNATRTIVASFWVPTIFPAAPGGAPADSVPIPPGDRGLTIILDQGSGDHEVADVSAATVGFSDGLTSVDSSMTLDPLPDEQMDSTATWNWTDNDDEPVEKIVIRYHTGPGGPTPFDTMEKLDAQAKCCGVPDLAEPEADDE
jgi:hypothetical protein